MSNDLWKTLIFKIQYSTRYAFIYLIYYRVYNPLFFLLLFICFCIAEKNPSVPSGKKEDGRRIVRIRKNAIPYTRRQRSFMTTHSNFHQINAFKLSADEIRLSNDDRTYSKGSKRSMRKYQILCENPKRPYIFFIFLFFCVWCIY